MATRKNATKTSSRAKSGLGEVNLSKKDKNQIKKTAKKAGAKAWLLAFVFLILGVGLGAGAWAIVCRNDCFETVGAEEVCLTLGEKYEDEGVKIVAFGVDASQDFSIETNLKIDEEGRFYSDEVGTFYIKYSTTNFKYGVLFKVDKIRLVSFVEPSEGGE